VELLSKLWAFLKSIVSPDETVVDVFISRHKLSLLLFILALMIGTLGFIGILGFIFAGIGFLILLISSYFQFRKE